MTRRENLLRLLRGQAPAWTPCSLNFNQWYSHHRRFDSLPEELRETGSFVEAMKVLGCDLFTRNLDGGLRAGLEGVESRSRTEPGRHGPRHTYEFITPHGTLTRVYEEQTDQSTGYTVEDLVKDWARDGAAYLWTLERQRCWWDREAYARTRAEVGDDGVVLIPGPSTPLKHLHIDFGLDHACLFVLDHPDAAQEICDRYWATVFPALEAMAADPEVDAVCLMDNVDAPFYSPSLCERYWTPYVRQAADLFHARGKRLFVHACGQLRALKSVFREAGVDGLEGMAHAPLGDWRPTDTAEVGPEFIYDGGFTAQEQVILSDDEVRAFYERFFAELPSRERFIFGAACQTTVTTRWDRLKLVVELCRQHGGQVLH